MDSNLGEINKAGYSKILNAENGLTFCIQVLDENRDSTYLNAFVPPEPTISVKKGDDDDEVDELISHEIVDECVSEKSNFRLAEDGLKSDSSQECQSISPIDDKNESCSSPKIPNSYCKNNSVIKLSIKRKKKKIRGSRRKIQNGSKPKKEKDVMAIVLKNMEKYKTKNSQRMKMMFDPKSGKHVIKSTFTKPPAKDSFALKPWIIDKGTSNQESKEKLFILNNHSKSNLINCVRTNLCSNCHSTLNPAHKESDQIIYSIEAIPQFSETHLIADNVSHNTNYSKTIHWKEGNINVVKDYNKLSEALKKKYAKSENQREESINFEFKEFFSDIDTYKSPLATKTGAAFGVRTFLSWEAVKERIEELQEETMTKFTLQYRAPKFKDEPEPFKKIFFELDTLRKDVPVVIPNSGVPFIYIGICVYTCHLGKSRRSKTKDCLEEDLIPPLKSKRIGCPALLSISRIARFPDYDISNLTENCESDAMKELKDAWDFDTARVRYYIEYHVREPKASDHKGHELQYLVNSNRFKEPVDPKILDKIRDLTRQGHMGLKVIHQKLNEYIREDLFKGEENPPLHRRRYNPSRRDIRYAIHKAREELKKEGKNMVQLECSALATEISQMVKEISNEQYLNQLKSYLMILMKTVKSKERLDTLFTFSTNHQSEAVSSPAPETAPVPPPQSLVSTQAPLAPKRTRKRKKSEPSLAPASSDGDFLVGQHSQLPDQVMEQFYINLAQDVSEGVFGAPAQLYAQELVDMNAGLADTLPPAPEDNTVTEVYYYYPDGTFELAIPEPLANVQT